MEITLPVSGKKVRLAVYSRKTGKALMDAELAVNEAAPEEQPHKLKALLRLREDVCLEVYTSQLALDELPNRDALLLERVTYRYNVGLPMAEIKNYVVGEGGRLIVGDATIATPAVLSPGSGSVN